MRKRLKWVSIFITSIALIVLFLNPINRKSTNLLLIGTLLTLWVLSLLIAWKNKILKLILIILPIILISLLSLNGPVIDKEIIRLEYVKSLKEYDGTKYLWGGETSLGIDCSGLVRRGLIDTYIRLGFLKFSPQYIRKGIYLWFNDLSAEAMGNEHNNLTVRILSDQTLNNTDYGQIREGDIMVTTSGVHTMAYIGNQEWIQADPSKHKVVILRAPDVSNNWYNVPSNILRWKDLE